MNGLLPLPVIDGLELDDARRGALCPDEYVEDRTGQAHRLPRWFYEVDSWDTATKTRVTEHFTLHELMGVDVREAQTVREFPRYVPTAVTLLAAHLELLRQAVGTYVWIAANGGYRSPSHTLSDHASPHCWGTAANIYRVGDEFLDTKDRIERIAAIATRVTPALWVRPYGPGKGFADDHLHVDIGYTRQTPRGMYEETGG
jgi:hypothetical protein